ncbi:MAG: hypothetical protein CMM58_04260 [Rhodospirillaceae bacterium]|nr:hypothetical protein [Rhodospirillaceae bacterium]|tara:strand:+ start:1291 stop:2472 length:1182 start_codon:yes stop_codon:yes gene_type:complete
MVKANLAITLIGSAILVTGCSFTTDALWPSLSGGSPKASSKAVQKIVIKPSGSEAKKEVRTAGKLATSPPKLGATNFKVKPARPGRPTGTVVGKKVSSLRDDLRRLQNSVGKQNGDLQSARIKANSNSQGYHERVASMRSRLQLGTTPGNPILIKDWNMAQAQLEKVNEDLGVMTALSSRVAADAALSAYILDSTRAAFGLSGAIDEDHDQLAVLEDDVSQTVVLIERLLTELSDDIRRQTNYIANERGELNTLALAIKNGEFFGPSLATTSYTMGAIKAEPGRSRISKIRNRRDSPIVVIRFDRPNVNYEQALYTAVNRVLQRRPDATFSLIAVSSVAGGAAKSALNSNETRRNAQAVLRSLVDMGLPPSRVTLSAETSASNAGNEVHIYLR